MNTPALATTRSELAELLAPYRSRGARVGFVPTMGALHAGHASLMDRARSEVADGPVVLSIFVNPLQFGPNEDLERYPRTLDADVALAGEHGVNIVFAPAVDEMYPNGVPHAGTEAEGAAVTVQPGQLADVLEGATRPGHFRGVLTVVAKLFGLVRPDVAVFGQKDYQQLALIRRMAEDLCMGIDVVGAETVRDPDGLALSSRNRYLSTEDRDAALTLSRALRAAQERAKYGEPAARWAARGIIEGDPRVALDYLALTGVDLGPAPVVGEGRVLVAAKVGSTRLIDNMAVVFDQVPAAPGA